jgi:hypothetical protein
MSVPLESQGAMTDGSKRLREVLEDDEFDMISSAAELLGEQLVACDAYYPFSWH